MSEQHPKVDREQGPATPPESQRLADEAVALEARLAEIRKQQEHDETWGANKPWEISIGANGERTDYDGFRERWAESLDNRTDPSTPGELSTSYAERTMTYPEMLQEARRLNQLNDTAGIEELWKTLQDRLVERADAEDWSESAMFEQLNSYEKYFFPEQNDTPPTPATLADSVTPAAATTLNTETPAEVPTENSAETSVEASEEEDESGGVDETTQQQPFSVYSQTVLYAPEFNGEARDTFLEYIAKREKGHWNSGRIKYGGKFHQLLNHIGAKGLAEKLTSTTEEEKRLSGEYTALVKARGDRALASYEKGSDEYYAKRAEFISRQHAADVAKIAELQKEDAKKPLSKLLRKAGYVAAGVAGGAVAMSPLGAIVGAAGALSAAAGIHVWANKRNALTKAKEGEGLEVDRVAQLRQADFTKRASSEELREDYDFDDVAGEHLADMHEEVEKNRKRLRGPLAATALSLLATRGMIYTAEAFSGDPGPATDSSFSVSEGIKNKLPSIDHSLDHPPMPSAPEAPTGYDYPWSWMADVAGPEQASGELHRLGEIASQNGYDVVWHALGDGIDTNDQISINGISDTDYVVNILNQFR